MNNNNTTENTKNVEIHGWKVFDKNLQCLGFQFAVGETFKHNGSVKCCYSGFHFHTRPAELFNYYSFNPENRVCKIVARGEIDHLEDKSACSVLFVGKELSWLEVLELCNTGRNNTGRNNSGDENSGDRNSGDRNSGYGNSGNRNSGCGNSGSGNSGYGNSGYGNSGNGNSGNRNSGYGNSGYENSGNRNSGYGNSANNSNGLFCTKTPPLYCFNKECPPELNWENPEIYKIINYGPSLTKFIEATDMSENEKKENPSWETLGGYLKTLSYKEAWIAYWGSINSYKKQIFLNLPNFDAAIFEEITGIKV